MPRFHLAFPVDDLDAARSFFLDMLGCREGRSAPRWVDFDFFGHQLSAHLQESDSDGVAKNTVDGDHVPVRHFGLILQWSAWEKLRDQLRESGARFVIEPRVRFQGKPGEQATMFVQGPSGNVLEFKAFRSEKDIFST